MKVVFIRVNDITYCNNVIETVHSLKVLMTELNQILFCWNLR
jgi:hypothetical protein